MQRLRAHKADLIYGQSGLFKTTNCAWAAKYFYEKYGVTTRWVGADNGGWEPAQPLVDQGVIEPWPIRLWPNKIEILDLAVQGYWPVAPDDPSKGLLQPAEILKTKVGFYVFEGLTSFGEMMMDRLRDPDVRLSQDKSYTVVDGKTTYSGGNMSIYGFIQDRMAEFVTKSHMIPQVYKVLWTALEGRGEDKESRATIFGPAIEGKKATAKASAWFGNTVHVEAAAVTPETPEGVIMWLRNHIDPIAKSPFQAKIRVPFNYDMSKVPAAMRPRIDHLYQFLDNIREENRANPVAVPPKPPVAAQQPPPKAEGTTGTTSSKVQ